MRPPRCASAWYSTLWWLFRYYANPGGIAWPPEVLDYNTRFTRALELIKRRHDPTVATVAQGVLEWKRSRKEKNIGTDMQEWLDRFYMSRIGIRFLIGQRTCFTTLWDAVALCSHTSPFKTSRLTLSRHITTTSGSYALIRYCIISQIEIRLLV